MQLHPLADPHDPLLDDYRALTDTALRRVREPAGGLYIAESAKVIERALQAGHRPRSVLTQQKWTDAVAALVQGRDVPVYVVADDVAERLTGFAVHRGVMAAMHRPDPVPVPDLLSSISHRRSRIAVLEGLTDHTNVGAVFRSAAALGVDAVLVTPTCADPLYRRAVRVSMGSVFQVPWTHRELAAGHRRPPPRRLRRRRHDVGRRRRRARRARGRVAGTPGAGVRHRGRRHAGGDRADARSPRHHPHERGSRLAQRRGGVGCRVLRDALNRAAQSSSVRRNGIASGRFAAM